MTNKELAEALWTEYKAERDKKRRSEFYKPYILGHHTLETIYHLLRDYGSDSDVFPYVCNEYLQSLSYRHYEFHQVLENAVKSFNALRDKGVQIPEGTLVHLETLLKMSNRHNKYMKAVEANAEHGIWDEKSRGNIKGFDFINDNIGSFHDSEVLEFKVDPDNDAAEITLYMCNGADAIVRLRFEGRVSCNISTEGRVYLYFGYFYTINGMVTLELDGFGRITAKHIEVIDVKENEATEEPNKKSTIGKDSHQLKPREGANSIVLKWNPAISSYPMVSLLRQIIEANRGYNMLLDWSVWDHQKIKKGDIVYWLKVGYGQNGIIGRGIVVSKPYKGQDWSGKGRETYYVDFYATDLMNPDAVSLLDADTLEATIPDFDWRGGHSGLILDTEPAQQLDKLWCSHIAKLRREAPKTVDCQENDKVFLSSSADR